MAKRFKTSRQVLYEMGLKLCVNCETILPLDDFYHNIAGLDDRQQYCKKCHNEKTRAWDQKVKERNIMLRKGNVE